MITVCFNKGDKHKTMYGLWQWDQGQILCIEGLSLPEGTEVHFATPFMEQALVMAATIVDENTVEVAIPNQVLVGSDGKPRRYDIDAYIYVEDDVSGETKYTICLPVKERKKPEDYVYTETETLDYKRIAEESTEQLEENNTQMTILTQTVNDRTDEILKAIDQAVFDKALLVSILNGTCENLTGDAITSIADYVFYKKDSLKTINLPNCISIGDNAFFNGMVNDYGEISKNTSSSLTTVNLPNCIDIGKSAFFSNTNMEIITMPNVVNIGDEAFRHCEKIKTLDLPNVTNIGENSFNGCRDITELNIPKLSIFKYGCFEGCTSITSIYLPLEKYTADSAFNGCTGLTSIEMPNVVEIQGGLFGNCSGLTAISLPKIKKIGGFDGCNNLITLDLPLLEEVNSYTFSGCTRLENFNFPNVKKIGEYSFRLCKNLKCVDMPLLVDLPSSCFRNCTSLNNVCFPNVTTIGTSVFSYCESLTDIDLPELTELGQYSFEKCSSLIEIYFPKLQRIKQRAFTSCSKLKKIFIPNTCEEISASSSSNSPFYSCSSNLQIFCEATEKPSGWGNYWNYYASGKTLTVHWGATLEDYEAYEVTTE